ncbi:MAG: leucine-rich repeat domain-containing protein [Eubacterium sp.]|nr:leucine-rich repeat domain-containing protein [Eubacterium sp.]
MILLSAESFVYNGEVQKPEVQVIYKEEAVDPDNVTSLGRGAFSVCKKLKKAKVSKSLTKIPGEAFSDCTKLTQVTFPSSSKVTKIGDMAFDNCKSMKSITLPKKVTMICDESFHWCDKLRTIKLLGKKHPKLKSYCVFTTDTIFAKKRTKNITFKCPNMSKKEKKKFRKYLKRPYMYFYGKVK